METRNPARAELQSVTTLFTVHINYFANSFPCYLVFQGQSRHIGGRVMFRGQ